MSNLPQSDWILAGRFVDGDLPVREAAAVESRIKSDAEFAAAVEELRSQSDLFSGLPRFKPSEDLADRTLQASLDQVKAIMGAWPIENSDVAVAPTKQASSESFDWKSTAALIASLAGVLMVGAMLLQNNQRPSGVAMNEAPHSAVPIERGRSEGTDLAKKGAALDDEGVSIGVDPFVAEKDGTPSFAQKGGVPQRQTIDSNEIPKIQAPKIGAFSGTPMKQSIAKRSGPQIELATNNSSAPVDQIWCVRQDSNASRNVVSKILMSNSIQVQPEIREQATKAAAAVQDSVEAFYVAATPGQMKLAMSQLSNSANIEMIQLPGGQDSLIADAIEQQFAQGNSPEFTDANAAESDIPTAFPTAASQALAQQLVSNAFPRNMPLPGPVPPILKSGSPIEGLLQKEIEGSQQLEIAANSRAAQHAELPNAAPNFAPKSSAGAGLGGGFSREVAKSDAAALPAPAQQTMPSAKQAMPAVQQAMPSVQQAMPAVPEKELGKYLDDSDKQLRQYLILVSGGEKE